MLLSYGSQNLSGQNPVAEIRNQNAVCFLEVPLQLPQTSPIGTVRTPLTPLPPHRAPPKTPPPSPPPPPRRPRGVAGGLVKRINAHRDIHRSRRGNQAD